jgi:hypothetical protein
VAELDQEDAKKVLERSLLQKDLLNESRAVAELLKLFNCLPLAIIQAAAYINRNRISISEYKSLYDGIEEEIIEVLSEEFEDRRRYRETRNPVATTWHISFRQIRKQDLLAAEYLSFMSCLVRENIPQSLLPPGPSKKKEIEARGTLMAYSFITKRQQELSFDMHRLIYLATRNWLRRDNQLSVWTDKALT